MKAIVNGKIILPDSIVEGRALLFDEKIVGLSETVPEGAEIIDAKGRYVAPGLVDIHIHGYLGEDTSDGSVEGIRKMAEGIVKNGVTAWLPTTMTVSYDDLRRAFNAVRTLMDKKNNPKGAQIMGVHAEGPFINPSKKGAQAVEYIRPADAPFLIENSDVIRIVTIAPEMPGALDCIREVTEKTNILMSMGHTAANYETAKAGIEAGVRHATHLFNAMTPLNHRDPGVVGASLADDRVSTELIADTFHISPDLFGLVAKVKGDNLILITDCTRAGGLADGEYTLGGQPIFVKGIECRLADGTIAGSVRPGASALTRPRARWRPARTRTSSSLTKTSPSPRPSSPAKPSGRPSKIHLKDTSRAIKGSAFCKKVEPFFLLRHNFAALFII